MGGNESTDWVFLRGLVRESAHWDDFPEIFAKAIPGAQVHLVDLPGNGRHWRQPSPLSLRSMMEAALAVPTAAILWPLAPRFGNCGLPLAISRPAKNPPFHCCC